MRKLLITIILGLAGFLGWFFYEKPVPPFGAVSEIETEIESVFSKIQVYEDSTNGNYVQFKQDTTRDGKSPVLWNKTVKPADQQVNWTVISGLPTSPFVSYWVDVYEGTLGKGYTINAEYRDSKGIYKYYRHFGPETVRDVGENTLQTFLFPTPGPVSTVATISYEIH